MSRGEGEIGMQRLKASDFDQGLLDLFDSYVHGGVDRRQFLERAKVFAVGGTSAAALLAALSPKYAEAQQIAKDDARLETEHVEYDSPQGYGRVKAYMCKPAGTTGKLPGVVVIHENRGLNPHIEDVARRTGLAGFLAFAPDGLTSLGGYPGTDDEGRTMQRTLDRDKLSEDFVAAVKFLKKHPGVHRQSRLCRVLLWRKRLQHARGTGSGSRRRGAFLRRAGRDRGRAEDTGTALTAICGTRRAGQCGMARLRRGAQSEQKRVHGVYLRGNQSRLPQRYDAAL